MEGQCKSKAFSVNVLGYMIKNRTYLSPLHCYKQPVTTQCLGLKRRYEKRRAHILNYFNFHSLLYLHNNTNFPCLLSLSLSLCLGYHFYCCNENPRTSSNLKRKGFIWFALPYYCSSPKEVRGQEVKRAGTWRQMLIKRPWREMDY